MKYNKRFSICRSPWSIGLVRLASSTTRKPQHLKKIPGSFASLVDKEIAKYNGLISGNRSRSLIPSVLRTTGLIFPRITKSHVTLVCYFVFFTNKLVLHQGTKGAVLYLKTAQVLLMQSVGRNRVFDISSLKAGVSRTRGGIPRCIPIQQRKLIRKGDVGVIRFWMTLFGLFRILNFDSVLDTSTITDQGSMNPEKIEEFDQFISTHFFPWMEAKGWLSHLKKWDLIPKPRPLSTSSPTTEVRPKWAFPRNSSSFPALVYAAGNLLSSEVKEPLLAWLYMIQAREFLSKLTWAASFYHSMVSMDASWLGPIRGIPLMIWIPTWNAFVGKLSLKFEPAGKIRVFAMVDAWTQWLMEPVQEAIFEILKWFPTDGTFNQVKPVERLIRKFHDTKVDAYSIDLSAATDRLPISLQKRVMSQLLGRMAPFGGHLSSSHEKAGSPKYHEGVTSRPSVTIADVFAEVWASLLVDRPYTLKAFAWEKRSFWKKSWVKSGDYTSVESWTKVTRRKKVYDGLRELKYSVGQPMGAMSSWAMLALTHHCIVQWAYFRVVTRKGKRYTPFWSYAVLGDDNGTIGKEVALEYLQVLHEIDVKTGLAKSIVTKGRFVMEFAKKFFIPGRADMVPFRESISSRLSTSLSSSLVAKYHLTWPRLMRFFDYGYKSRSLTTKPLWALSTRSRILTVFLLSPNGPWARGANEEEKFINWLTARTATTCFEGPFLWFPAFVILREMILTKWEDIQMKAVMQDSVNCEKRDIADFSYSSLNSIDFDRLFTLNRRSAPQVRQRDHLDYMDEQGWKDPMKFPEHYKHLRSGFIVTLGDLKEAYASFRETCSLFYVDCGKIGLIDIQGVKKTGSFKEEFLLSANLFGLSPERLEYNPHIPPSRNLYNLYVIYREALDTLATPLLSDPAPQLRAEEKDYFEDFVALYKIWVELSRSVILSQQMTQSDKDMLKRLGEDFSLLDWWNPLRGVSTIRGFSSSLALRVEANNLSVEPVTGSERHLLESIGRARRRGERGVIHHLSGPTICLPSGPPRMLPSSFFSQHFPMQSWRHFLAGFILVARSRMGPVPWWSVKVCQFLLVIVEELLTLLLALLLVLQIRIPIPDAFVRLQIKESTIASDVTSWVIHFEPHHADPWDWGTLLLVASVFLLTNILTYGYMQWSRSDELLYRAFMDNMRLYVDQRDASLDAAQLYEQLYLQELANAGRFTAECAAFFSSETFSRLEYNQLADRARDLEVSLVLLKDAISSSVDPLGANSCLAPIDHNLANVIRVLDNVKTIISELHTLPDGLLI